MLRSRSRPVRKPLESLAEVVRELELVAGHSREEFRDGLYVRRAAERLVQLGVDLACELALGLLDRRGESRRAEGYEEAFRELGKTGLIPEQLAEKLAAAAVLRRQIVFGSGNGQERDLFIRLPFIAVLLREYGRQVEDIMTVGCAK